MVKWVLRRGAFASLFFFTLVHGYIEEPVWDSPCQCSWCGSFEGAGVFLWLTPVGCAPAYVIYDRREPDPAALPSGEAQKALPGTKPGFRFGLGYLYEGRCDDFWIWFTGLWASGHRQVHAENVGGIWPTIGQPQHLRDRLNNPIGGLGIAGVAQARSRIGYEAVTGEFARRRALTCWMWVRGALGVHWTRIRDRLDLTYQGTALLEDGSIQVQHHEVRTRSEVEGTGPHLGIDLHLHLPCGLGTEIAGGAAVLIGQRKVRMAQTGRGETVPTAGPADFDASMDVRLRSNCTAFPLIEGRIGLTYRSCCGPCHCWAFAAGYEWTCYPNALGAFDFNDRSGTNQSVCSQFGLSGLYLSARLMI